MNEDDAIRIRERFHAEGNRFGMMARHHEERAMLLIGAAHAWHRALAEKWQLAQTLCYQHAGEISHLVRIPEYGEAWHKRLQPCDLVDQQSGIL